MSEEKTILSSEEEQIAGEINESSQIPDGSVNPQGGADADAPGGSGNPGGPGAPGGPGGPGGPPHGPGGPHGPGHGGPGPTDRFGNPLPSPMEAKKAIMHKGACSSPKKKSCPCPKDCILHGRCCDCVRHHIEERRMLHERGRRPVEPGTDWLPECLRLAQEFQFDVIDAKEAEAKAKESAAAEE